MVGERAGIGGFGFGAEPPGMMAHDEKCDGDGDQRAETEDVATLSTGPSPTCHVGSPGTSLSMLSWWGRPTCNISPEVASWVGARKARNRYFVPYPEADQRVPRNRTVKP